MRKDALRQRIGLCVDCVSGRHLKNQRGSAFYLCEKSRLDSSYRPYPAVPVRNCPGYEADPARDSEA